MKLIVGLGNPGDRYKNNRHNIGHVVVNVLASKIRNSKLKTLNKNQIQIHKSPNFMNDSGSFIKKLLTVHGSPSTDYLYVVHDDLDIPLGSYKIQYGRGPKDHNGLLDIYEKLGTKDFWHVRVGIENRMRDTEYRIRGEQYVLQDFTEEEKIILNKAIKAICKKLVML